MSKLIRFITIMLYSILITFTVAAQSAKSKIKHGHTGGRQSSRYVTLQYTEPGDEMYTNPGMDPTWGTRPEKYLIHNKIDINDDKALENLLRTGTNRIRNAVLDYLEYKNKSEFYEIIKSIFDNERAIENRVEMLYLLTKWKYEETHYEELVALCIDPELKYVGLMAAHKIDQLEHEDNILKRHESRCYPTVVNYFTRETDNKYLDARHLISKYSAELYRDKRNYTLVKKRYSKIFNDNQLCIDYKLDALRDYFLLETEILKLQPTRTFLCTNLPKKLDPDAN